LVLRCVKKNRFLVNFYGFTEAIAQIGPPRGDGFGAAPSIIPYKSTKNQKILHKGNEKVVNLVYYIENQIKKYFFMATEATNPIKKYLPRLIFLSVLLVGGYFGYQKYKYSQTVEVTDNAQIEGKTAPVLARAAGYVQTMNVEDYQNVKANDLLVEIDPAEYRLAAGRSRYTTSLRRLRNCQSEHQKYPRKYESSAGQCQCADCPQNQIDDRPTTRQKPLRWRFYHQKSI
jgi:hypothetical protein